MGVECHQVHRIGQVSKPVVPLALIEPFIDTQGCRVQDRASKFAAFRDKYISQTKQSKLEPFRNRTHYDIADVQTEVQAAVDEYEKSGSSIRSHPIRTIGRSWTNNASAIENLLLFLPNGDYGSILCGALTLVLNVGCDVQN